MSDDEREWKPNRRPQSTMARSFSAALHEMFDLDNSLGGRSLAIEQKKQEVSTQNKELEALEARLRRTEELLKEKQNGSGPASGSNSPHRRTPIKSAFDPQAANESTESSQSKAAAAASSASAEGSKYGSSNPAGPASQSSEHSPSNEYVVVDGTDAGVEAERPKSSARYKKASYGVPPRRPAPPPVPK